MLREFELQGPRAVVDKLTIGHLDGLLGSPRVVCGVQGLYCYYDRIVVLSQLSEVLVSVEGRIDEADLRRELLSQPRGELVRVGTGEARVRVKASPC